MCGHEHVVVEKIAMKDLVYIF